MVVRGLAALFFGVAAIFLVMLVVLAAFALSGSLYDCAEGGVICREGVGALFLGLILLTAAVASVTIGLWIRSAG